MHAYCEYFKREGGGFLSVFLNGKQSVTYCLAIIQAKQKFKQAKHPFKQVKLQCTEVLEPSLISHYLSEFTLLLDFAGWRSLDI